VNVASCIVKLLNSYSSRLVDYITKIPEPLLADGYVPPQPPTPPAAEKGTSIFVSSFCILLCLYILIYYDLW
jgi:hypothetical protein